MSTGERLSDRAVVWSQLTEELRAASASFRKKKSRHFLSTKDAIYCAFSTPGFSVRRDEAQRDAARRLEQFGVRPEAVRGKRVLDLGL